ncbi:Hpt domain-containing protein [Magnetococcales bacterium HHB-1]
MSESDLLIDPKTLEKMEKNTSPQAMPRMINLFLKEIKKQSDQIQLAIDQKDSQILQQRSHLLKSSAGTFGALKLQILAERCDQACKESAPQAFTMATQIINLIQQTTTAFQNYLERFTD